MIRPKGMEGRCDCSPWQKMKEQIQALYERVTQLGYKDTELENDISDIDDEIAQIAETLAEKVDIEQGSLNEGLYLKVVEGKVTPSPVDIPEGGAVMASIIVGDWEEGEELSIGVYERSGGRYQTRFYKKIAAMADAPRYIFKWVSGSITATISEGEWTDELPMTLGYATEATATNYNMPGAGWYIYVTRTYYEDPIVLGVSATALGEIDLIYQEADQSTAATVGILSDSEIYQIIRSEIQGFADTGLYNVNVGSWNAYKYIQVNDWGGLQYVDISIPEPTPAGAPDILTSMANVDAISPMGGTAIQYNPADLINDGLLSLASTASGSIDEPDGYLDVDVSLTKYATADPPYITAELSITPSVVTDTDSILTYDVVSAGDDEGMTLTIHNLRGFAEDNGMFEVSSVSNLKLYYGSQYNQWTGYGVEVGYIEIPDEDITSVWAFDGSIYVSVAHSALYYLIGETVKVRGSNWYTWAMTASADIVINMKKAPEDMRGSLLENVKGIAADVCSVFSYQAHNISSFGV